MKKFEEGQPRRVERRGESWGRSSSRASLWTRSTTLAGEGRGGTQKEEPGTKGSQSGVAFFTRILWIRSSKCFSATSYSAMSTSTTCDAPALLDLRLVATASDGIRPTALALHRKPAIIVMSDKDRNREKQRERKRGFGSVGLRMDEKLFLVANGYRYSSTKFTNNF